MTRRTSGTYTEPDGTTRTWQQQTLPVDAVLVDRDEWLRMACVGLRRHAVRGGAATASTIDPRNVLANHVLGAVAEGFVAHALDLDWQPDDEPDRFGGDLQAPIVGRIDVRSTHRPDGGLFVHDYDADCPIVLACGWGWWDAQAYVRLPGWILGADAQQQTYWRPDIPTPAYVVPQRDLLPMDSLKRWTEGKGS